MWKLNVIWMKILNNIACKLNSIEFIFIEFKWYIELISNSNSIWKKMWYRSMHKILKICSFIIHDYDVGKTQIWKNIVLFHLEQIPNSKSILAWRKNNFLFHSKHIPNWNLFLTWNKNTTPFHSIQSKFKRKFQIKNRFWQTCWPYNRPPLVIAPTETLSLEFA